MELAKSPQVRYTHITLNIKLNVINHRGPVMRRLLFIPDQPNLANMHKYSLNFIIPILYFNAY